jgi:hypothetical protein
VIGKTPSSRAKAVSVKARADMPVDAFPGPEQRSEKTKIVSNKMRHFAEADGKSPPDVII